MRNRAPFLNFFLAIVVVCWVPPRSNAQTTASVNASRTPVVVELFTSEGCSSCPPADTLLQKLEAQQPVAGVEIIALEEHVDYWNHDGWVDPYSSPDWTQRQIAYASFFKNDAYTPEAVVDGRSQFVGNDAGRAIGEIEKAAHEAKTEVAITAPSPASNGSQRFNVSIGKVVPGRSGDGAEVWLAVTEDGLHSSVSKGENAGRVLQHVATLRSLQKLGSADAKGNASFAADPVVKFNSQWNLENLHVTVFIQRKKSREIVGAASIKING
jgi:hypothetical protein